VTSVTDWSITTCRRTAMFPWLPAILEKATGLDVALNSLAAQPCGTVLLVVMAAGLAAFAVFTFFDARLRRRGSPLPRELQVMLVVPRTPPPSVHRETHPVLRDPHSERHDRADDEAG
jgi:Domain of Unknown Function (DUF1206)